MSTLQKRKLRHEKFNVQELLFSNPSYAGPVKAGDAYAAQGSWIQYSLKHASHPQRRQTTAFPKLIVFPL